MHNWCIQLYQLKELKSCYQISLYKLCCSSMVLFIGSHFAVYFFTHAFSSKFFQVSSIIIFNGWWPNHQKLLKIVLSISMWLIIHRRNIGTQYLLALFPCILQWLSDSMVLTKIAVKSLIWWCSNFMNAFASYKLMTPFSDGNKFNPDIVKATSLYHSSPNFPFSTFFFIIASIVFRLNPPLVTLYWLIFSKHNNLTTS